MTISIPETGRVTVTEETLEKSSKVLNDTSQPLSSRFRALFQLKGIGSEGAIEEISKAFKDDSNLLKHEVAYVLGQMKNTSALGILYKVLADYNQDAMVRHEAAEAIGAIGLKESIKILEEYLNDKEQVVRETCQLAIAGLNHSQDDYEKNETGPEKVFNTIDPAPALKPQFSTKELTARLLDTNLSLFDRYRAMFALRNRGDSESVIGLARGFEDESALFRHEIAYVFGQLQHPDSVPSLIKVLSNPSELNMVRHEAAEALGSIATPECFSVLKEFCRDSDRTVRESCVVGLDMYEFETSSELI